MSGTFPTNPLPTSLKLTSMQPTLVSLTHNLKRQVRTRGGQRWGFTLTYSNRSRAEMAPVMAFLQAQQGQYGTFQFAPTLLGSSQTGSSGGSVNATTAGGSSVPATITGSLKAGDFVKFSGHSKVYMVVSDIAGSGTLSITPPLHAQVAIGEAISAANVQFTMARSNDNFDLTLNAPQTYDWTVEMVEVV